MDLCSLVCLVKCFSGQNLNRHVFFLWGSEGIYLKKYKYIYIWKSEEFVWKGEGIVKNLYGKMRNLSDKVEHLYRNLKNKWKMTNLSGHTEKSME